MAYLTNFVALFLSFVYLSVAASTNYTLLDEKNVTCLFYGVDYEGGFNYTVDDKTWSTILPTGFTTLDRLSQCAGPNDPPKLVLQQFVSNVNGTLTHIFSAPTGNASYVLQSITWEFTYKDMANKSKTVTATTLPQWNITLHDEHHSYVCKAPNQAQFNNTNVSLTLSNMLVQVAGFNGKLSKEYTCSADLSTTSITNTTAAINTTAALNTTTAMMTTTMLPSSTTPAVPPNGKYILYNTTNDTCFILDAGIRFMIPYNNTKTNKTITVTADLPRQNATVTGSCSLNKDMLMVSFYNGWSFSISVEKDAYGYYALNAINFTYNVSSPLFPGAPTNGTAITVKLTSLGWFNTSVGNYYQCNHTNSFDLTNGIAMETAFFDMQGYASFNGSTSHVGSPNDCVQDTPTTVAPATDNTVPIAVGAALAGLVLIVLIAYFIGRRRSRNGYQSM